tara:strand:- start:5798 stop:6955 length:1158 start_codon:yes stop_codon:yes gene_type:complete
MIRVAVVSVARSDYSIIKPVLLKLYKDSDFKVDFYVSGMHLSKKFGYTIKEIEQDKIKIRDKLNTNFDSDTKFSISKSISKGVLKYAEVYEKNRPDLLIITGDRFEMLAAVIASIPYNIVIAHLRGGELTYGAFDDSIRHSITKFSHIHFCTTKDHAKRINQMGEEKYRIKIVGCPSLDNIKNMNFLSLKELSVKYNIIIKTKPILVTYHPSTKHPETTQNDIQELIRALEKFNQTIIFTAPNADTNNNIIDKKIRSFCKMKKQAFYIKNLGTVNYYSLLKVALIMVGNSSSGISEAASFKLPVINIGDRQQGRSTSKNVINCKEFDYKLIVKKINVGITNSFRKKIKNNIYQRNKTSINIVNYLKKLFYKPNILNKKFVRLKNG